MSATGRVTTSINGTVGVGGAYVAIVNASNVSQEYFNTTADPYGNFQITGINATYSSVKMIGSPSVGNGSYEAGLRAYMLYANKSPYGEGYSEPFSVGSDNGDYATVAVYLPGLSLSTRTADSTPKATPLPPALALLSLLASAAILLTRKNK